MSQEDHKLGLSLKTEEEAAAAEEQKKAKKEKACLHARKEKKR